MSDNDLRKQRTRSALLNALIHLMETQNVHSITVKKLCAEARVNRSTFYMHYLDMPDFLDKVMHEMARGLVLAVIDSNKDESILLKKGGAFQCYCRWFEHVRANKSFFKVMLSNNGMPEFYDLMVEQGVERYTSILRQVSPRFEKKVSLDILAGYIVNAHMGLLRQYVKNDTKYSCEYMAKQIVELTFQGSFSELQIL